MSANLRTFGDLMETCVLPTFGATCSFCKTATITYKYSTRHYVCRACAAARSDVVLPRVKRREALQARLNAWRAEEQR